jgi:hypothetical protein
VTDISSILSQLRKVRRLGAGRWSACCPAHDDHNPSLVVWLDHATGRPRFHCYTGCHHGEIRRALDTGEVDPAKFAPATPDEEEIVAPGYFAQLARRMVANVVPGRLQAFADAMGVNVTSLRRLRVGCSEPGRPVRTWSFPMTTADRDAVIGIRLRLPQARPDGTRYICVRRSRNGLFLPEGLKPSGGDLFLPEGPTSTAAMLTLGLNAAGRPTSNAGRRMLLNLVDRLRPDRTLVVGENDRQWNSKSGRWLHPGLVGARTVADVLRAHGACPDVRVLVPPEAFKDVREWLCWCRREHGGAARGAIRKWIDDRCGAGREEAAVA